MERGRGRLWMELNFFYSNLWHVSIHSATCSCIVEFIREAETLSRISPRQEFSHVSQYIIQWSCDRRGRHAARRSEARPKPTSYCKDNINCMKIQVQAAMHNGFFQHIFLFLLLFLLSPVLLAEGQNVVLLTALAVLVYTLYGTAPIPVSLFL
jgi:hypothetical protein